MDGSTGFNSQSENKWSIFFLIFGLYLVIYYTTSGFFVQVQPYDDVINSSYSPGHYLLNGTLQEKMKTLVSSNRGTDHILPTRAIMSMFAQIFTSDATLGARLTGKAVILSSFLLLALISWHMYRNVLLVGLVLALTAVNVSLTFRNSIIPYSGSAIPASLLMLYLTLRSLEKPTVKRLVILGLSNVFAMFSYEATFVMMPAVVVIAAHYAWRKLDGLREQALYVSRYAVTIAISTIPYFFMHFIIFGKAMPTRKIELSPSFAESLTNLLVATTVILNDVLFGLKDNLRDWVYNVPDIVFVGALGSFIVFLLVRGRKFQLLSEKAWLLLIVVLMQMALAMYTGRSTGSIFANIGFIMMLVVADFFYHSTLKLKSRLSWHHNPTGLSFGVLAMFLVCMYVAEERVLQNFTKYTFMYNHYTERNTAFNRALNEAIPYASLIAPQSEPFHTEELIAGNMVSHQIPIQKLEPTGFLQNPHSAYIERIYTKPDEIFTALDMVYPYRSPGKAIVTWDTFGFQRIYTDPESEFLLRYAGAYRENEKKIFLRYPQLERFGSPGRLEINIEFARMIPDGLQISYNGVVAEWQKTAQKSIRLVTSDVSRLGHLQVEADYKDFVPEILPFRNLASNLNMYYQNRVDNVMVKALDKASPLVTKAPERYLVSATTGTCYVALTRKGGLRGDLTGWLNSGESFVYENHFLDITAESFIGVGEANVGGRCDMNAAVFKPGALASAGN